MTVILLIACCWSLTGLAAAAVLARHGHNFWLFGAMGLAYGPLLLVIWFEAAQGQSTALRLIGPAFPNGEITPIPTPRSPRQSVAEPMIGGWIDVLVGLDGSADSVQSTKQMLDLLGPAVRRIRLTSVLDHEVSNAPDHFTIDERRIEHLRQAADTLGLGDVELALASGQPDRALTDQAQADGFDVVVVAHRRHPVTSLVRGSTTGRLARSARLPVLIGPPT